MKIMKEYKNPDWKQWLPAYGVYRVIKDNRDGKPSLADINHPIKFAISTLYHAFILGGLITSGLSAGLEKLLY